MSELAEIIKIIIANPSPTIILLVILGFIIYKFKELLHIFLDIKDFNKKRLIQKFEETHNLQDKSFLDDQLKHNYQRLCEESQLHAIIGCQYCSKEMAHYILNRKNISRAIRIYHRIKDNIEFEGDEVKPIVMMKQWRVELNYYIGMLFYFIFCIVGATPFLLPLIAKIMKLEMVVSTSYYSSALIIFLMFFIMGCISLYQGLKPKFCHLFCELEENITAPHAEINPTDQAA